MKPSDENFQIDPKNLPNPLQRFFILCSGADLKIVYQFPHEWNKYAGVGGTIFFTALISSLSGGYAINFVFDSVPMAFAIGLLWALVIFNLDRYFVLSLKKEKIPTKADITRETDENQKIVLKVERRSMRWHMFWITMPRFFIAIIIALSISKPIELRLFNGMIERQLSKSVKDSVSKFDIDEKNRDTLFSHQLSLLTEKANKEKKNYNDQNTPYVDNKNTLTSLNASLKAINGDIVKDDQIIKANTYTQTVRTPYFDTVTRTQKTRITYYTRITPEGARAEQNKTRSVQQQNVINEQIANANAAKTPIMADLNSQAATIDARYKRSFDQIQEQLADLASTYSARKKTWEDANLHADELAGRLDALGNISAEHPAIKWASITLMLLIISIETAPIIVKLLTKRSAYDSRLETIDNEAFIEDIKKINAVNEELKELMAMAVQAAQIKGTLFIKSEQAKADGQQANNTILLNKIIAYQRNIANLYVEHWYEDELGKAQAKVNDKKNSNKNKPGDDKEKGKNNGDDKKKDNDKKDDDGEGNAGGGNKLKPLP